MSATPEERDYNLRIAEAMIASANAHDAAAKIVRDTANDLAGRGYNLHARKLSEVVVSMISTVDNLREHARQINRDPFSGIEKKVSNP